MSGRVEEIRNRLAVDIYGQNMRCLICGTSVDLGHQIDCPASEAMALIDRLRAERDEAREALHKIDDGADYMCYYHHGRSHGQDCAVGIARRALNTDDT